MTESEYTMATYTIYRNPKDNPDGYVVRQWMIGVKGAGNEPVPGPAVYVATLEEARAVLPGGMWCLRAGPRR